MKEKAHILNLTLPIEVIYIINPKFHYNNLNNIDLYNKNQNIHRKIYKIHKLNINHNNNNYHNNINIIKNKDYNRYNSNRNKKINKDKYNI